MSCKDIMLFKMRSFEAANLSLDIYVKYQLVILYKLRMIFLFMLLTAIFKLKPFDQFLAQLLVRKTLLKISIIVGFLSSHLETCNHVISGAFYHLFANYVVSVISELSIVS